jgi:hypothetical protein
LLAVLGAETVATLLAGLGIFMTALGWAWVAFVWGYALVWFLITDRVKLLGYRILDPAGTAADTSGTRGAHRSRSDLAAMAASVAPFHTDVNTSPDEPVYHDTSACPYGQEITRDGHDVAATDDRRRCEWCEAHADVAPFHTDTYVDTPVYHDLCACPYGQEITRDGHDVAGSDDRRRCEWCEAHAGVAPFHTDTDVDQPVYHDLVACPYAQEITRDGHDIAGSDGRRRCEWCEAHAGVEDAQDAESRRKS